jgi:aminomethyltransferase
MLSYHADMDAQTNPFELGLDRLVNLDTEAEFIGKAALRRIRDEGVSRMQVGLVLDTDPLAGPNTEFWPILKDASRIGQVTSAVYSPRLGKNIALAFVEVGQAALGNEVQVLVDNLMVTATVVERPFYDAKKSLATGAGQVA